MTCFDEALVPVDYARYLAAKTTVDDRALNRHVLAEVRRLMPAGALRVLEVGAGLGTMAARLVDWGAVGTGEYILLDADRRLLDCSGRWLRDWAAARGLRSGLLPDGLRVGDLRVRLVHAELGRYLEAAHGAPADVLIANSGLDLAGEGKPDGAPPVSLPAGGGGARSGGGAVGLGPKRRPGWELPRR